MSELSPVDESVAEVNKWWRSPLGAGLALASAALLLTACEREHNPYEFDPTACHRVTHLRLGERNLTDVAERATGYGEDTGHNDQLSAMTSAIADAENKSPHFKGFDPNEVQIGQTILLPPSALTGHKSDC
ncbi:MAG TPA: hypothetical protein VFH39_01380 [Candidatus Saccharimonadales bacterium]|nr:hypothetical protein [Candidatus Saccharimonadales bacterium]